MSQIEVLFPKKSTQKQRALEEISSPWEVINQLNLFSEGRKRNFFSVATLGFLLANQILFTPVNQQLSVYHELLLFSAIVHIFGKEMSLWDIYTRLFLLA